MNDGSIRIGTKLETGGVKKDLKTLEKECEKAGEKIASVGKKITSVFTGEKIKASSFTKLNKDLEKTRAELAKVEAEIVAIQKETDKMLPMAITDEQTKALLEMEQMETADLLKKRDELTAQAKEYEEALAAITAEQERQKAASAAMADLNAAKKDEDFVLSIRTEGDYNAVLEAITSRMAMIEQQAERVAQKHGLSKNELLQQDAEYAKLAQRLDLLKTRQFKFTGEQKKSTKEAKKLHEAYKKVTREISRGVNRGIKSLTRMSLAVMGVRAAYSLLRQAASRYLQDNEALSNQVEGIWNVVATAIGPVVQQIIHWITVAISYVNAFIKALWGVDLVAKANEAALTRQAKATHKAAEAAEEAKRQTAGFDEMTKLSDTSNSAASDGSEGGGATGLFTPIEGIEIPVDEAKKFVKNLGRILALVGAIFLGLKAWEIVDFFGGSLKTCAGVALVVAGAITMIYGICDAWINGLDWGNFFMILGGGAAVVGGLALILGDLGVGIGLAAAGIAAVVIGIKDMITNGLNAQNILLVTIGIIAAIIGVLLIFNATLLANPITWIVIAIIALIGVIALCIVYWDDIVAAMKYCWEKIVEWFGNIGEWFADVFKAAWEGIKNAWNAVVEWFKSVWEGIKKVFSVVGSWFKDIFTKAWEGIKTAWSAVKTWFSNLWEGIKNVFSKVGTWFRDIFTGAWYNIKNVFSSVGSFFGGIWETIKEKFTSIGSKIGNAIGDAFKKVVNSIISFAENTINKFIKAINAAIELINEIPGVEIKTLSLLSIPKLARGGIVNNPGRGVPIIAGEGGAEAVLPLENNTGWMDILADKINGGDGKPITVQVILNGKKIHEELKRISRKQEFATNGAI